MGTIYAVWLTSEEISNAEPGEAAGNDRFPMISSLDDLYAQILAFKKSLESKSVRRSLLKTGGFQGSTYDALKKLGPWWLSGRLGLLYPEKYLRRPWCKAEWAKHADRIARDREMMFDLKLEILEACAAGKPMDACIDIIKEQLSAGSVAFYARLDGSLTGRDISVSESPEDWIDGQRMAPTGGLVNLLDLIGLCEEEREVGLYQMAHSAAWSMISHEEPPEAGEPWVPPYSPVVLAQKPRTMETMTHNWGLNAFMKSWERQVDEAGRFARNYWIGLWEEIGPPREFWWNSDFTIIKFNDKVYRIQRKRQKNRAIGALIEAHCAGLAGLSDEEIREKAGIVSADLKAVKDNFGTLWRQRVIRYQKESKLYHIAVSPDYPWPSSASK